MFFKHKNRFAINHAQSEFYSSYNFGHGFFVQLGKDVNGWKQVEKGFVFNSLVYKSGFKGHFP